MDDSQALVELLRRVETQRRDRAQLMRQGGCMDFPAYRHEVGYLAGLEYVVEELQAIRRGPEQQEDDDGEHE